MNELRDFTFSFFFSLMIDCLQPHLGQTMHMKNEEQRDEKKKAKTLNTKQFTCDLKTSSKSRAHAPPTPLHIEMLLAVAARKSFLFFSLCHQASMPGIYLSIESVFGRWKQTKSIINASRERTQNTHYSFCQWKFFGRVKNQHNNHAERTRALVSHRNIEWAEKTNEKKSRRKEKRFLSLFPLRLLFARFDNFSILHLIIDSNFFFSICLVCSLLAHPYVADSRISKKLSA